MIYGQFDRELRQAKLSRTFKANQRNVIERRRTFVTYILGNVRQSAHAFLLGTEPAYDSAGLPCASIHSYIHIYIYIYLYIHTSLIRPRTELMKYK